MGRQIAGKTNELQQDLNEHKIVIETLDGVDGDRKCFRMVGGVLVERTVKDVLPALISNRDKMGKLIESLDKLLVKTLNQFSHLVSVADKSWQHILDCPLDQDSAHHSEALPVPVNAIQDLNEHKIVIETLDGVDG